MNKKRVSIYDNFNFLYFNADLAFLLENIKFRFLVKSFGIPKVRELFSLMKHFIPYLK